MKQEEKEALFSQYNNISDLGSADHKFLWFIQKMEAMENIMNQKDKHIAYQHEKITDSVRILEEIRSDIKEKFDDDLYMMRTMNIVLFEFKKRSIISRVES